MKGEFEYKGEVVQEDESEDEHGRIRCVDVFIWSRTGKDIKRVEK